MDGVVFALRTSRKRSWDNSVRCLCKFRKFSGKPERLPEKSCLRMGFSDSLVGLEGIKSDTLLVRIISAYCVEFKSSVLSRTAALGDDGTELDSLEVEVSLSCSVFLSRLSLFLSAQLKLKERITGQGLIFCGAH